MNSAKQMLLRPSGLTSSSAQPRAEMAYDFVRTALLEGDLGPGDRLSVVTLSEQLDCSRVPIMEALKRLESEGFLEIIPQVGCRVVIPDPNDVSDFFKLFAAVEATITALAAERCTKEEILEFRALCAHIDHASASAGGPDDNDPQYRHLNILFHSAIHRMAKSPVSTRYAASLWDRSDFYIKLVFGSLYFSNAVKRSHRAIRKAIYNGDPDAARTAITDHLQPVGERVSRALLRQQKVD